ncbi:MAG TPA: DUF3313 domain-containing protein [Xanthomonadaceae bacterium]|nr:DUF3313 domain-containing protein [Xanthomonadaceae bacterium]
MQHNAFIKNLMVSFVTVVVLAGCASTPPPRSGFLVDYPDLKPDPGNPQLLWWEKPDFDWKRYQKLMIDPVVMYYDPKAKNQEIRPDDLNRLADEFRDVVTAELGKNFPVVNTPGQDVLRIRAAITEIIPANPALNVVTTVVAFVPLDMGGAAIEAEFIDSMTNERVAAMVERKLGTPFDLKSGFTSLGHARASFKSWAAELKRALETGP